MNSFDVLSRPVHFSPRRLTHANLFVRDVEQSLRFYERVCGMEIVLRQPRNNAGFVSNGNTHHDIGMIQVTPDELFGEDGHRILARGQGAHAGLNHVGWEMETEFDLTKAHRRALAAGWKIHRTVRHKSSHSVYLFDPDGNVHEFYADITANWRGNYERAHKGASGQWNPGEAAPCMEPQYHVDPEIRRVADAALHPLRITHLVLIARNFDRMRLFMTEGAGLHELSCDEQAGLATYSSPAARYAFTMAIVRAPEGAPPDARGLHHVSFEMASEDEVAAGRERLAAAGVPVEREVDAPHKLSLFIRDPNGVLLEFYAPRPAPLNGPQVQMRDAFLL